MVEVEMEKYPVFETFPFFPPSTGPENWHVLPADKACCQPYSIHPEQRETEGGPIG